MPSVPSRDDAPPDGVPRLARPFVAALIALMIASAVFVWEPWPLTSFRLFSQLRHDEQTGWAATIVAADGDEVPYPVDSLERGFRNFGFRMAEFATADSSRRDELCRTWIAAAPEATGADPREVRLYRRYWLLSEREDDRALPGTRELLYVCTEEGVRVVG